MSFYDLTKGDRAQKVAAIQNDLYKDLTEDKSKRSIAYFSDEDTYIRKTAYLSIGRIYNSDKKLQQIIIRQLNNLQKHDDFKIRQTVINAAGEIGKADFTAIQHIFDKGLLDPHHSPRNAVIGSLKKMGEVNPEPVLKWAKKYLRHADPEIRREICHGIELRGRKFPQDILPLLRVLEFDELPRVRNTLVHVLGQIAYKKGCLQVVVEDLKSWTNAKLIADALDEIVDVHERYKDFAAMTQKQAKQYITDHFY